MTSELIKQIMLFKYYNRINLNSEKIIIKAWNIYRKETDKDAINESDDSFKVNLQNVLRFIII